MPYFKVRDIDFSSAKKLKKTLDQRIDSVHPNLGEQQKNSPEKDDQSSPIAPPSEEEMQTVYTKLNACRIKAAFLSFIDPYADQFIDESHLLPIIPDLFETGNVT